MLRRPAGGRSLEVLLFTLSSLVLYHIGIGVGVFLVPLQVVASRRGERSLLAACGLFMLAFLSLRLLPFLGGQLRPDILTLVETSLVLSLLLGLLAVNLPLLSRMRTLYRLVAMTAVAGLAAIPLVIGLSRNAQFRDAVGTLFTETSRMLSSLLTGKQESTDPALSALLSPQALQAMAGAYLPRSVLAVYFGVLSFSWWAGQTSASRTTWQATTRFHFAEFRLESFWLWPLIGALALMLLDLFLSARSADRWSAIGWQYGAWNIGLVMVFLFAVQGLAILRFLFEKYRFPRLLWLMLVIGIAILAASPRAGVFVAVALPAFGVSENWIRYRVVANREPNESP